MGIYIKNMEMPKTCLECMTSNLRTTIKCSEWTNISAGRRETCRALCCPLVEVQTPHGRLIDEGKLFVDIEWSDIEEAPTVIEAEDEQ